MDINKEGALLLLEQMCADAAEDFEGGVVAYLDAMKAERRAVNNFKRSLTLLAKARERKYNALKIVISEYAFLTDKEVVKPELNGDATVIQMIVNIIEELDEEMYSDVAGMFIEQAESKTIPTFAEFEKHIEEAANA